MLAAIPAYLAIGDGGFATAACRDMTMKSSGGDREGTLAVFQSTWLLLLVVSLVGILLALGFSFIAPLDKWLGFTAMNAVNTRIVLLLLVAHVMIGFQGGLLNGGFWVSGSYPIGMACNAITQLLEFSGLAIAVLSGGGPMQAAAVFVCGRLIGTGLMWIGQRRASPWLRHGFTHASLSQLRRLCAPAFASLAFPLGNALNIQGMRIIVGLALGPAAVAVFMPLRTLSNIAAQPRAIINRLTEPEMAMAYGAEDFSLFGRLFLKSSQLALWGCLITAVAVAFGAHWFFPVWTSGKVLMHWPTFYLLLGSALVNSLWYTALMVPYATNRHVRIAVAYSIIYGAGAFITGYFGAKAIGLEGAGFAILLAEVFMTAFVIPTALKMTHVSLFPWFRFILKPPFAILTQSFTLLQNHCRKASN